MESPASIISTEQVQPLLRDKYNQQPGERAELHIANFAYKLDKLRELGHGLPVGVLQQHLGIGQYKELIDLARSYRDGEAAATIPAGSLFSSVAEKLHLAHKIQRDNTTIELDQHPFTDNGRSRVALKAITTFRVHPSNPNAMFPAPSSETGDFLAAPRDIQIEYFSPSPSYTGIPTIENGIRIVDIRMNRKATGEPIGYGYMTTINFLTNGHYIVIHDAFTEKQPTAEYIEGQIEPIYYRQITTTSTTTVEYDGAGNQIPLDDLTPTPELPFTTPAEFSQERLTMPTSYKPPKETKLL